MKVVTEGHRYALNSQESGMVQVLQFIHKEHTGDEDRPMMTVSDGTTNEEVLAMLIDRMKYLHSRMPCRENSLVITKLEESLMWLEKRTKDRLNRGVLGKDKQ